MRETIINLETVNPIEFFGVNNGKLDILKRKFPLLKILSRGTQLKLSGAPEQVDGAKEKIDTLIPRKTLAELTKLTAGFDDEISLGMDENHIYFQVGPRLLISRMLYGQFPNYEMVMPKNNDKSVEFNSSLLNLAIRRVALMADERSHAIRFHLEPNQLVISSQNAEEGDANETLQTDYNGEVTDIGFNAQYLQEFLNVIGDAKIAFEFKDGNSQAQLHPSENGDYEYKYVVMPMRI